MATRKQVERFLAKRYKGHQCYTRENLNAPNAAERAKIRAEITANKAERDEITKQIAEFGGVEAALRALAEAARFVVDVEGGTPSIPNLNKSLVPAEQLLEGLATRRELDEGGKNLSRRLVRSRCEAYKVSYVAGVAFGHELGSGDTWGEVLEIIKSKA